MNTTLLVSLSGNNIYDRVDLFEDIPITLTIQQLDLTNLTQRRIPYSKTIQIPGTNTNDKIFEHYFEVNGTEFNPLNKVKCVVQYRGTDIFNGILRLNTVIQNDYERVYEVFLFGEVSDWVSYFRDLNLQDLDWTDLNHDLSYSAVTKSWECINDGASGLFDGKIVYPLINYGLEYNDIPGGTGQTPTFTYDFDGDYSFSSSGNPMSVSFFKPAIQVKEVLNRIFSLSPFTIQSDFFDSAYFTSIYMDTFQNGQIGLADQSGSAITSQNIFKVNSVDRQFFYQRNKELLLFFSNVLGDAYDPLNDWYNNSVFRAPLSGTYQFNYRFNIKLINPLRVNVLFPPRVEIRVYKHTSSTNVNNGTLVYTSPSINLNQALNPLPVNLFFNFQMDAGEYMAVYIVATSINPDPSTGANSDYMITPYVEGGVEEEYQYLELFEGPTISEDVVNLQFGIQNIGCFDFLKSMITLFNLVIFQDADQPTIIKIEPWNWYYNDTERVSKNYTQKLDTSQNYYIEPLTFDLAKDVIFTYTKAENEYLPKLWYDKNDFVYGRKKYTTSNNIFVGEQRYEVPFGPLPTSGVTNAPNFIIGQLFYENNNQQLPYATIPHLFFWAGNRYVYKDNFQTQQASWYLLSGSTAVAWNTYPVASHLSTLDSQFSPIISDLNFSPSFDFFGNDITLIQQFTQNNLFQLFWETYIDNLYSNESRRLRGQFYMKPSDYISLRLNDKFWIKDAYYSIEKINEANLVSKDLTEISLIKEKENYYKIVPPAPSYGVSPNQAYPSPEPFDVTLCYVSSDKDAVCAGTAPLENIWYFGFGTIEAGDKVYYDVGTSYQLVTMGTYLRQVTSGTLFVVADIYGRVLQQIC